MAKATSQTTTTRLSTLFVDPFLRDAFERAERDLNDTSCVTSPRPNNLLGGAAAGRELVEV